MKMLPISFSAVLAVAILLSACSVMGEGTAPAVPVGNDEAKAAKPALAKGMTAAMVQQLIGKPREIKPLESVDGLKAETWIYRRRAAQDVTQDAVLTEEIPAFLGPGLGDSTNLGTTSVPVYRTKHTTIYQITALLMIDGQLVLARQWFEQESTYDN